MRKIALVAMVVLLVGLLTGCAAKTKFELSEWKVIDDEGYATLQIKFTATKSIMLSLIDPDGFDVDTDYCGEGVTASQLRLTKEMYTTPKAGQYKLIVEDEKGVVATETFTFTGAKVTISDVSIGEKVNWKMKNEGDLPYYPSGGKVTINGVEEVC